MAKTVVLEELPADTQRILEQLLSSAEPVILSRNGVPLGGMVSYATDSGEAADYVDEEEISAVIAAGEAEFEAGQYITLDQFRSKYAAKIQAD